MSQSGVRPNPTAVLCALPYSVKTFMEGIAGGMRMPALPEGEITEEKRVDAIRRLREI